VQLGRAGVGQAYQFLASVLPGADGNPTGVDEGAQVAGQCRLVQGRKLAEIALPYLPHGAQALQERVLGRAQAYLA
jgi:hypothetical protein